MGSIVNSPVQIQTAAVLENELLAEGYLAGVPVRVHPSTERIDRATCAALVCGHCGYVGAAYRPYYRGSSYRVLAVCPCGHGEEL